MTKTVVKKRMTRVSGIRIANLFESVVLLAVKVELQGQISSFG